MRSEPEAVVYDGSCEGEMTAAGRGEKHRGRRDVRVDADDCALMAATIVVSRNRSLAIMRRPRSGHAYVDPDLRRIFGRTRNSPINRIGRFGIERIDQAS